MRPENVFGTITPPPAVAGWGSGAEGISKLLNNVIELIYIVAAIIFVFMVLWSGLEWIISGGDKDKVSGAQKRITWAVIGITVLALTFLIAQTVGHLTGFTFFAGQR